MKLRAIRYFLVSLFLVSATQAYGLIDASVMVGKRSATMKTGTAAETDAGALDVTVSAHVSPIPIPMVSIGFGVAVTTTQWNKDEIVGQSSIEATEAGSFDLALETMVSVSLPFLATPYGKVAYNVSNKQAVAYEISGVKYATTASGSGYTIGLGAKFSILPFTSVMVEYSMYNGTQTPDEIKVGDVVQAKSDTETTVTSSSILAGIEVDIGL